MRRRKQRRVAVAMPYGLAFGERLLQGIAEFAAKAGDWTFTRLPDVLGTSVQWLRDWSGDGAFALITSPADAKIARSLRFPVINLASHLQTGLPSVAVDHRRIGELAAEHLIDRGFRRFGYFGTRHLWFSELRRSSFRQTVMNSGGQCDVLEVEANPTVQKWRYQEQQLLQWLSSLQPPVGIMASNDLRARLVLTACRSLKLRVPEDVGVIGVDNDPVFAEFDDPPLTSVSRNDREVGRKAAELLAKLMAGGKPPRNPVFVCPDKIVQRRSTETIVIDDPIVAQAVQFIHERIHVKFGIGDLIRDLSVSRRSFEHRFRQSFKMSPYHYMNQVRVDAAKRMLADSEQVKLNSISRACGFSEPRRFRAVFRRIAGVSPSTYRQQFRQPVRSAPSAQYSP